VFLFLDINLLSLGTFVILLAVQTHSKSNGLAENGVKTVKIILQKSPHYYFKGVLAYKTSHLSSGQSPAERLTKRRLKTTVPIHPMLHKGENDGKIVQKKMEDEATNIL